MCEKRASGKCTSKSCKTLGTLARIQTAQKDQNTGFGRWAYNSQFIAQLVAQSGDVSSDQRRHRKAPNAALKLYTHTQKIIDKKDCLPLAKSA